MRNTDGNVDGNTVGNSYFDRNRNSDGNSGMYTWLLEYDLDR